MISPGFRVLNSEVVYKTLSRAALADDEGMLGAKSDVRVHADLAGQEPGMKTHHVPGGPPEHRRVSRVFLASALHQFRGPDGIVGIKLAGRYEAVRTILLTQGAHRPRVARPSALPSPR